MNIRQEYERWLNHPNIDEQTKEILQNMSEADIQEAFFEPITFGTAGMRGILGVGTQRMNRYTVAKATHGYARYLKSLGDVSKRGVAIAYDNRHQSLEFATFSAKVLAFYDIPSYIYPSLRPTPVLSFTVRDLNCIGGIMITASHNPKEYNGYKLYDENGCQLVPDLAAKVVEQVNAIEDELALSSGTDKQCETCIHWLEDGKVDRRYMERIFEIQIQNSKVNPNNLKVVYSPEHGTGKVFVEQALNEAGYDLIMVESQATVDPDFSGTKSPNPEEEAAYEESINIAIAQDADIIIVTDPDADRLGVAAKHNGEYVLMTGNQSGALLLDYLLHARSKKQLLPENSIMFNTVVTSDLGELVAKHYGVETEKTLTGFKFIGDRIEHYQQTKEKSFVFGYEESYGCLIEPFVRDKDAVQASLMLCEMAAYYKTKGIDLIEALENLYEIHGAFAESQQSISLKGLEGSKRIARIMTNLQERTLESISNVNVIAFEDYQKQVRRDTSGTTPIHLPSADVLKYYLEDGSWIAIRPSGTEPKMKIYYSVKATTKEEASKQMKAYQVDMMALVDTIE